MLRDENKKKIKKDKKNFSQPRYLVKLVAWILGSR